MVYIMSCPLNGINFNQAVKYISKVVLEDKTSQKPALHPKHAQTQSHMLKDTSHLTLLLTLNKLTHLNNHQQCLK